MMNEKFIFLEEYKVGRPFSSEKVCIAEKQALDFLIWKIN